MIAGSMQVPGVHSVTVNLASNTANILFDAAVSQPQTIIEAVGDAGVNSIAVCLLLLNPAMTEMQKSMLHIIV